MEAGPGRATDTIVTALGSRGVERREFRWTLEKREQLRARSVAARCGNCVETEKW
jgi:hypothetical protein